MATKKIIIKMASPETQLVNRILKNPALLNDPDFANDPATREALKRLRARKNLAAWQAEKRRKNIPSY